MHEVHKGSTHNLNKNCRVLCINALMQQCVANKTLFLKQQKITNKVGRHRWPINSMVTNVCWRCTFSASVSQCVCFRCQLTCLMTCALGHSACGVEILYMIKIWEGSGDKCWCYRELMIELFFLILLKHLVIQSSTLNLVQMRDLHLECMHD